MIVTTNVKHKFRIVCDFCGSTEKDVGVLIASPNGTHICGECVVDCMELVLDRGKAPEAKG